MENWEKRFDEKFPELTRSNVLPNTPFQPEEMLEDVTEYVKDFISSELESAKQEERERTIKHLLWRIDCNTMISELYGWKSICELAADETKKMLSDEDKSLHQNNNEQGGK